MKLALEVIKAHRCKLTRQQFNTLKGQCKAGDIDGALKGLSRILGRL